MFFLFAKSYTSWELLKTSLVTPNVRCVLPSSSSSPLSPPLFSRPPFPWHSLPLRNRKHAFRVFEIKTALRTDQRTDGPMDGQTLLLRCLDASKKHSGTSIWIYRTQCVMDIQCTLVCNRHNSQVPTSLESTPFIIGSAAIMYMQ